MSAYTIKTIWEDNDLKQNTHIYEYQDGIIVIDAGCSVASIRLNIDKPIKAVFITHAHYDHIKYIREYDELNIPIYAHKSSTLMFKDSVNNASIMFGMSKVYNIDNLHLLEDNDVVVIDDIKVQALYTPGHSIDGMCYMIGDSLFSGDTVFAEAVGRDDLPTGNTKQLIKSLARIMDLDYKALYTGHGRSSAKQEQAINIPQWIKYLG